MAKTGLLKKLGTYAKDKAAAKATRLNAKTALLKQKAKGSIARSIARNSAAAVSSVATANSSSKIAEVNAKKEVGIAKAKAMVEASKNNNANTALNSWNSIINSNATPVEGTGDAQKGGSTQTNTGSSYNDPSWGY